MRNKGEPVSKGEWSYYLLLASIALALFYLGFKEGWM